ncbi:MAG: hypothetical protein ANABAC_2524 [Anaerolineae bacterium]|nr:MAG: hypothetical protein ANABAC_2524 [Anaerolineae bacterium]
MCQKWLKERQERPLSLEEIRTYCRILTAIAHTIALQAEVDEVYTQVEKSLLQF